MSSNTKIMIGKYHVILRDFLPSVLNHIILEYAIFSTQETFIQSVEYDGCYKMVCDENIIYKYGKETQCLSKHSLDTETYVYSPNTIIYNNHIYVLDNYSLYIFDKKNKQINNNDKQYRYRRVGLFVYDDKIYIFTSHMYILNYIDENNIQDDIKFTDKIYSVKFANEHIYALMWNDNIIQYSLKHKTKVLVYEHKFSLAMRKVHDFCVHGEHIYILEACGEIIMYDHKTNFIRNINTQEVVESIDYHNGKLYIKRAMGYRFSLFHQKICDIYEINHQKIPYLT